MKPIHRDIRGIMMNMERLAAAWASSASLFMALVLVVILEETKDSTAEMMGSRNRPMALQ